MDLSEFVADKGESELNLAGIVFLMHVFLILGLVLHWLVACPSGPLE